MAVAASNLQFKSEEVAENQDELVQSGRSEQLDKACVAEVHKEATIVNEISLRVDYKADSYFFVFIVMFLSVLRRAISTIHP